MRWIHRIVIFVVLLPQMAFAYTYIDESPTSLQNPNNKWINNQLSLGGLSTEDNRWATEFQKAVNTWQGLIGNFFTINYDPQAVPPVNICGDITAPFPVLLSNTYCSAADTSTPINFSKEVLAITRINALKGIAPAQSMEFKDVRVIFNRTIKWDVYTGPWRSTTPAGTADFTRVAMHEIGHALGLGHEDAPILPTPIMVSVAGDVEKPQQDDINGLVSLYNPNPPTIDNTKIAISNTSNSLNITGVVVTPNSNSTSGATVEILYSSTNDLSKVGYGTPPPGVMVLELAKINVGTMTPVTVSALLNNLNCGTNYGYIFRAVTAVGVAKTAPQFTNTSSHKTINIKENNGLSVFDTTETLKLLATATYADGTTDITPASFVWKSDNPKISVKDGVVSITPATTPTSTTASLSASAGEFARITASHLCGGASMDSNAYLVYSVTPTADYPASMGNAVHGSHFFKGTRSDETAYLGVGGGLSVGPALSVAVDQHFRLRAGDVTGDGLGDLISAVGNTIKIYWHDAMDAKKNHATPINVLDMKNTPGGNVPIPIKDIILADLDQNGVLEIIAGSKNYSQPLLRFYRGNNTSAPLFRSDIPLGLNLAANTGVYPSMQPIGLLAKDRLMVMVSEGDRAAPQGYALYNIDPTNTGPALIWFYDLGQNPRDLNVQAVGTKFWITGGLDVAGEFVTLPSIGQGWLVKEGIPTLANGIRTQSDVLSYVLLSSEGSGLGGAETVREFSDTMRHGSSQQTVVDLDNDGKFEIVSAVSHNYAYPGKGTLRIVDLDTGVMRKEITLGDSPTSVLLQFAISDLNNDEKKEIILISSHDKSLRIYDGQLQLINSVSPIPIDLVYVANLDKDADKEILVAGGSEMRTYDGNSLSYQDVQYFAPEIITEVLTADLNRDKAAEVIVSTTSATGGKIYLVSSPKGSNSVPAPVSKQWNINMNERLTFKVEARDPDGETLTFSISKAADRGNVYVLNPTTGEVSYTPFVNFTGTDSFVVRVSDAVSTSNAIYTIIITGEGPQPRAKGGGVVEWSALLGLITLYFVGLFFTRRTGIGKK